MSVFPTLPLLESLAKHFAGRRPLEGVGIVATQHLLETTGSLIEKLFELGAEPRHTFLCGKVYSTNAGVAGRLRSLGAYVHPSARAWRPGFYERSLASDVRQLWERAWPALASGGLSRILVLDDGGLSVEALRGLPDPGVPVTAIEQTMSGIARFAESPPPCPVIEVASSAAKRHIEPPMIWDATLWKLRRLLAAFGRTCRFGVVGAGSVGTAVAGGLAALGYRVAAFDCVPGRVAALEGVRAADSLEALLEESQVVFGCTGSDLLAGASGWRRITGRRILISCSSQDREFATALAESGQGHTADPLADLEVKLDRGKLLVPRGGFPANFDGSPESVGASDIQMTRALLLAAALQAAAGSQETMLRPEMQSFTVTHWAGLEPQRAGQWYSPELLANFEDLRWIAGHSGGRLDRASGTDRRQEQVRG